MTSRTADGKPAPRGNHLLAALPPAELERLEPLLEPVELTFKQLLYEAGAPIDQVYFPVAGVLSQVAVVDGEAAIEINTVGREGMVGIPAFLGVTPSASRVFCQIPGNGLRLEVAELHRYLSNDGPLHQILNRYTQATLVTLARGVACNRLHTTEERMSRWLLMTRDRVDDDTFPLTQEFLSQMLGVRRATVSLSAGLLQQAQLISYSRGQITILDRPRLEETTCDCYQAVRDEHALVFTDQPGPS